jgi:hypothetical protein
VLDKLLAACRDKAIEISNGYPPDGEVKGTDHDIITRLAAILFIARTDGKGILEAEMKALVEQQRKAKEAAEAARKAAEDAERKRLEQERARQASEPQVGPHAAGDWPPLHEYQEDGSDDLPF